MRNSLILRLCTFRIIQEHKGSLYSNRSKERPGERYVCLIPHHLENLDLDVNLALIGRYLTLSPSGPSNDTDSRYLGTSQRKFLLKI